MSYNNDIYILRIGTKQMVDIINNSCDLCPYK